MLHLVSLQPPIKCAPPDENLRANLNRGKGIGRPSNPVPESALGNASVARKGSEIQPLGAFSIGFNAWLHLFRLVLMKFFDTSSFKRLS